MKKNMGEIGSSRDLVSQRPWLGPRCLDKCTVKISIRWERNGENAEI